VRAPFLLALSLSLCVCGCDRAALMKKVTPADDESFARKNVDLLRENRIPEIERVLDPSIPAPKAADELARMRGMFPAEAPKSIKVVDVRVSGNIHNPGSFTHALTLEYEFPDAWILVSMSIKRTSGVPTITQFYVKPIATSLETLNRFSLVGKSGPQYAMLVLALLAPIFSIYVLVLCFRTEKRALKWLWALFIVVGVCRLAVNWTTGEFFLKPLAAMIPCASATEVPAYGPWMIAIYLPLGAILYIAKRIRGSGQTPGPIPRPEDLPLPSA
jgi:hypothetical protein